MKSSAASSLDGLSYYRASAYLNDAYPPLAGDTHADVCVIGAGFTGLSAALELTRAGMKVVVLEAGAVGWGASGRNGGQICTGYSPGMGKFEKVLGHEAAQACFDIAEEGKQLIRDRVEEHAISCDLKWGYMIAAARPGQMAGLEEHGAELSRFGYDQWAMVTRDDLRARLGSEAYHGALRETGAGHFHPLNYCLGLAAAVTRHGGCIHEHCAVTNVAPGAPARVSSAHGVVSADHIIIACNGYLNGLIPAMDRRIMPVGSYMAATEPLGENRARALIRGDEAVADANFVVDYFRLSADHRLLFGGRCSYSGIHPKDLAANMAPRIVKIFPQLRDAAIDYVWGGYIAITHNRLPDARRIGRNIYYAQGYSGQGVVLAGMFGKLMAEAVLGTANRFDVFSRIKHAPFPGGPLRRPALALGMLYYRLRDVLS